MGDTRTCPITPSTRQTLNHNRIPLIAKYLRVIASLCSTGTHPARHSADICPSQRLSHSPPSQQHDLDNRHARSRRVKLTTCPQPSTSTSHGATHDLHLVPPTTHTLGGSCTRGRPKEHRDTGSTPLHKEEHAHGFVSPRPTQRDRTCICRARHDWARFPHVSTGTCRGPNRHGDHGRQRAIWPGNLLQGLGCVVPRTHCPADWQHQVRLDPGDMERTHCLRRHPVPAWIFCCRLKQHSRHPAPLSGRPQGCPGVGLRGASSGRTEAQHGSAHGAQLLHQPLRFRG